MGQDGRHAAPCMCMETKCSRSPVAIQSQSYPCWCPVLAGNNRIQIPNFDVVSADCWRPAAHCRWKIGVTRRYSYAQQLKPSNIQHPTYAYQSRPSNVQHTAISRCRRERLLFSRGRCYLRCRLPMTSKRCQTIVSLNVALPHC